MAAASKGHKEVIKVLLKHGADILLTSYDVSDSLTAFCFQYFSEFVWVSFCQSHSFTFHFHIAICVQDDGQLSPL